MSDETVVRDLTLKEVFAEIKQAESYIRGLGLRGGVVGRINFFGDELSIDVSATEHGNACGMRKVVWERKKSIEADITEAPRAIAELRDFCSDIPGPESRAIEAAVASLSKIAEELPDNSNAAADALFAHIRKLLRSEAERIAKYGLPRPGVVHDVKDGRAIGD